MNRRAKGWFGLAVACGLMLALLLGRQEQRRPRTSGAEADPGVRGPKAMRSAGSERPGPRAPAAEKHAGTKGLDRTLLALLRNAPDEGRDAVPDSSAARALGQRLENEAPDPLWTQTMKDSLFELTETAGVDGKIVRSVWCSVSLCRITFAFPDLESAGALLDLTKDHQAEYAIIPPSDAAGADAWSPPAEASAEYLVYTARPGATIATLAETAFRGAP